MLRKWSDFDRKHSTAVNSITEQLREISATPREKASSIISSSSSNALTFITRGSPDQRSKLEKYGRESPIGSWIFFSILLTILLLFLLWLPIAETDDFRWKKTLQVSNVLVSLPSSY